MHNGSDRVTLSVSDRTEMDAYVARPSSSGQHPGMLVFQDAFGLNAPNRAIADRYAEHGFVAIAPDLFHRTAPCGLRCSHRRWKAFCQRRVLSGRSRIRYRTSPRAGLGARIMGAGAGISRGRTRRPRGVIAVAPQYLQLLRSAPAGAYLSMYAVILVSRSVSGGPQQCGAMG